jgi:hypothetical protein
MTSSSQSKWGLARLTKLLLGQVAYKLIFGESIVQEKFQTTDVFVFVSGSPIQHELRSAGLGSTDRSVVNIDVYTH